MEWLHLLNRLEQLHHIDQKSISTPHVELLKLRATPTVVWWGVIYPQGTRPMRLVPSPSERSQVPHHKPILGANQGVGIVTRSYCYQMGHLFNHCPFVDDKTR